MTARRFIVAPDSHDQPTIFELVDRDGATLDRVSVIRLDELPTGHQALLWSVLVGVLTADADTVERVARAMWDRGTSKVPTWDEMREQTRKHFRDDARAGLAALAAPTSPRRWRNDPVSRS